MQATRTTLDPRLLKPHRSRREPTDPAELATRNERRKAMATSWLETPINEVYVRDGDYAIGDGNERVAGCLLLGVTEIPVSMLPACTTDAELDDLSLLTDFHKTALTPFEQTTVAKRRLDSSGMKRGDLATKLNISAGHLSKLLSVFDCSEQVQALAAEGKLSVEAWYAISRSTDPLETLRVHQGGGDRQAVAASAKPKADKPPAPPERHDKLAIPFSSAIVLVKAKRGEEPLNLPATRKLLVDALAKVDQAIEANYGIKTAARSFADTKDKAPKVRKVRKPREAS